MSVIFRRRAFSADQLVIRGSGEVRAGGRALALVRFACLRAWLTFGASVGFIGLVDFGGLWWILVDRLLGPSVLQGQFSAKLVIVWWVLTVL